MALPWTPRLLKATVASRLFNGQGKLRDFLSMVSAWRVRAGHMAKVLAGGVAWLESGIGFWRWLKVRNGDSQIAGRGPADFGKPLDCENGVARVNEWS